MRHDTREAVKGLLVLAVFFLLMAWWSAPQAGAFSASYRGNSIRITNKPCTDQKIIEVIKKLILSGARIMPHTSWGEATGIYDKKNYKMCWIGTRDGRIVALFEDGDYTIWSMSDFKKDTDS